MGLLYVTCPTNCSRRRFASLTMPSVTSSKPRLRRFAWSPLMSSVLVSGCSSQSCWRSSGWKTCSNGGNSDGEDSSGREMLPCELGCSTVHRCHPHQRKRQDWSRSASACTHASVRCPSSTVKVACECCWSARVGERGKVKWANRTEAVHLAPRSHEEGGCVVVTGLTRKCSRSSCPPRCVGS